MVIFKVLLGKIIIMHTKKILPSFHDFDGSSHIGLPEVISAKSPVFLEILEST